jgi:hypothetical protein
MTGERAPSTGTAILSTEGAQRIMADAAQRYFASFRSRVDAFVDRHFLLAVPEVQEALSNMLLTIGWRGKADDRLGSAT